MNHPLIFWRVSSWIIPLKGNAMQLFSEFIQLSTPNLKGLLLCYCWRWSIPPKQKNAENSVLFFQDFSVLKGCKKVTKVGGRETGSYKSSFKITDYEYQASEKPIQFSKIAVLIILILVNENFTLKCQVLITRSRVFSGRILQPLKWPKLFLVWRFYHTTQYISTLFSFVKRNTHTHTKKQN